MHTKAQGSTRYANNVTQCSLNTPGGGVVGDGIVGAGVVGAGVVGAGQSLAEGRQNKCCQGSTIFRWIDYNEHVATQVCQNSAVCITTP